MPFDATSIVLVCSTVRPAILVVKVTVIEPSAIRSLCTDAMTSAWSPSTKASGSFNWPNRSFRAIRFSVVSPARVSMVMPLATNVQAVERGGTSMRIVALP